MFPRDEETSALLREATAFADKKEWEQAIACLRKAKSRMIVSEVQFTNEAWCKLPLYLSRAGRFDEAMVEFDWLIADLDRRARQFSFMDRPEVSFGKGESKRSIYNLIVRSAKKVIEEKRQVALRRREKLKAGSGDF